MEATLSKDIAQRAADNIRILSAAMVEKAKSGHPGGAMGGADFVSVLFSEFLEFDPENPRWFYRDRFFLDPGHMSPMLYSVLSLCGKYSMDDLAAFRQWGSITPGHPEVDVERGVENTSGPLGQGHTFAVGSAITERFLAQRFGEWTSHKTYAFISDGGIQEEIAQGAGRIAGHLGLSNLIMFYDSNDIQLSTTVDEVTVEDIDAKYTAWGWNVVTIDGNDVDQIRKSLKDAKAETEKPTLIIGKTVMGKGAVTEDGASYERKVNTHGQPLTNAGASIAKTIENLGGDAENPFTIFPDVQEYFAKSLEAKKAAVAKRNEEEKAWAAANADLAAKLNGFINNTRPSLDLSAVVAQTEGKATRDASGNVLAYLADNVENVIVASADLSESDKTNRFLDKTTAFKKGDFSGAFLQAGVAELTMAAIASGMALHGGVVPVCATFFVFSDYMKPAVRLAALMELPVVYVWTHDAFRVGEDGPTHQPIEQEAQIRLLEKLHNHSGDPSMLVLRPADADETTTAWQLALDNAKTPTGLILSRQGIKSLPGNGVARKEEAKEAAKGAYTVYASEGDADVILLGNGSEVATLLAGGQLLEEKGIKVKVVSAISEGLFKQQSAEYQASVIPAGTPVYGLTAGLPAALESLAGVSGKVEGLTHFGYSAPAGVLDEKFGYTAERVFKSVTEFLGK